MRWFLFFVVSGFSPSSRMLFLSEAVKKRPFCVGSLPKLVKRTWMNNICDFYGFLTHQLQANPLIPKAADVAAAWSNPQTVKAMGLGGMLWKKSTHRKLTWENLFLKFGFAHRIFFYYMNFLFLIQWVYLDYMRDQFYLISSRLSVFFCVQSEFKIFLKCFLSLSFFLLISLPLKSLPSWRLAGARKYRSKPQNLASNPWNGRG